jgi:ubiquinone/menaquinone biosynthesis C-methylase UbiE
MTVSKCRPERLYYEKRNRFSATQLALAANRRAEAKHIDGEAMSIYDDAAERKAQTRKEFNAVAADYDSGPGCFAHFGRCLVEAADIVPGQHVLDIASGRGAVFFPSAERVGPTGQIVGIDFADEMVNATNEDAVRRGLIAQVRIMDAEQLEFPDGAFDHVLCGFGVMHFPNQDRALGEFLRVLKPGGRLAVSTWRVTQRSDLEAALIELDVRPPRPPGWTTEPENLSRLLARAGFSNVRVSEESQSFHYADVNEYWQTALGTGMRRVLEALDAALADRARAALAERLRPYEHHDGLYVAATALIAVADR